MSRAISHRPVTNFEAVNRHIQDWLSQFIIRKSLLVVSRISFTSKSSRRLPPLLHYQLKTQRSIVIMPALSLTHQSFSTFHSNTTAIPTEITSHTTKYAIADTQLLPMGGACVGLTTQWCPYRNLFWLFIPSYREAQNNCTNPPQHRRSPLLQRPPNPSCLLAAFFREGPGQDIAVLRNIRFLSISYLDDHAATD